MEATVLEHFGKTVRKDPLWRYEVSIPWLRNKEEVPDNIMAAEKSLRSTTLSLKAVGKFEEFDEAIQNWL
jgi:hypothetical protein